MADQIITREQASEINPLIGNLAADTLHSIEVLLRNMNTMLANVGDPSANGEPAAMACYTINELVCAALSYERSADPC